MLLKHFLALVILSLIVVLTMPYCYSALQGILSLHAFVFNSLGQVFAEGNMALIIKQMIALLSIPLISGIILVGIYWITKFDFTPYILLIVWIIWLILTTAVILQYLPK